MREGSEHPVFASVREYQDVSNDLTSTPSSSNISDVVRQRTTLALMASVLTIIIQGLSWVSRNTQFSAHPYVLPVTVFVAVCLGGPIQVVLPIKRMSQQAGWLASAFGQEVIEYPLGPEWRRGLDGLVFIFLQIQLWTTVWTWKTCSPKQKAT